MWMNLETLETYKSQLDPNFKGPAENIDEMILPTIILLNKKGYTTNFSCSGHIGPDLSEEDKDRLGKLNYGIHTNETYISFMISSKAFENLKKHCPKDFEIDDGEDIMIFDTKISVAIRKFIKPVGGDEYFGRLIDVYNNCTNLYKMALDLPDLTKKEEE